FLQNHQRSFIAIFKLNLGGSPHSLHKLQGEYKILKPCLFPNQLGTYSWEFTYGEFHLHP
ncbi:MAG: hypothetical protein NTV04_07845, partial [Deltaproteobacteria bacterium]|nr:hypothetical protein [Deltaproteobacteria bacterium]